MSTPFLGPNAALRLVPCLVVAWAGVAWKQNLSLSGLDTLRLPSGVNFSGFSAPLPGKELEAVKVDLHLPRRRPALSARLLAFALRFLATGTLST